MAGIAKFFTLTGAANVATKGFSIIDIIPQGSANFESDKMFIIVQKDKNGAADDTLTLDIKAKDGSEESGWGILPVANRLIPGSDANPHAVSISVPFNGQFRFRIHMTSDDTIVWNIAIIF